MKGEASAAAVIIDSLGAGYREMGVCILEKHSATKCGTAADLDKAIQVGPDLVLPECVTIWGHLTRV